MVKNPITDPVHPRKQSVRRHFGSHPYFTRRPWNVVQAYIKHFAPNRDDVVLDPFGGSGVTAIEAVVLGRKAIHVDLNPLANFICQQVAVAPVDLNALRREFIAVEEACRPNLERLYTLSPEELAREPLDAWYPRGWSLPKNADARTVEELFTRRQLIALSQLYRRICEIADPVLKDLMRFAFSATLNKCNLTYSTTKGRSEGRGNSGIMHTYRYWLPKEPVELNVWNEFSQKFKNLIAVKKETNQAIGQNYQRLQVIHASATQLTSVIEEESVDYIFTDPPYGSHIAYLDLSTMWNAWLGFDVVPEDKQLEAIEGGDLGKSRDDYATLLQSSLVEMHKALKSKSWLTIVFAHKDLSYWSVLIDAAQNAGFEYANTVVQESFQFSRHKRANPLSVLAGELILNLQKKPKPRRIKFDNNGADKREMVTGFVHELLGARQEGLTTEDVYNQLVPRLLERGLFQVGQKTGLLELDDFLKDSFYFEESSSRWYLSQSAAKKGKKILDLMRTQGQFALDFPQENE
ncbi:MAG: hypothetical protein HY868_19310 [Chloroflexi bacterium]|nr:hypothetical protein [Chloroflexota bacterium]